MLALVGSPALAELPVVDEAHIAWLGCDYSIKVRQDSDGAPNPKPLYRISVENESLEPGSCLWSPNRRELATSKIPPRIKIEASHNGPVLAYSWGENIQCLGPWVRISIHNVNPSTLESSRQAKLEAWYQEDPTFEGWPRPGALYLDNLIVGSNFIQVTGDFSGNRISYAPNPVTGTHFVASYPMFFEVNHSPVINTHE
ncbi:hypothetical protein BON30_24885 [Cystobacter ferrugineus]|uniref:Uncharacterized protein n=1 Tax=Cystobacter ferrugineus TaxID=83449 RepID=A0A1L9B802_9BACT|nr:hypothetical protein BON30_24885 [Cystobacter ferrugineus]